MLMDKVVIIALVTGGGGGFSIIALVTDGGFSFPPSLFLALPINLIRLFF
jgi:hypothetical protein